MKVRISFWVILISMVNLYGTQRSTFPALTDEVIAFPKTRPEAGNFVRPEHGQVMEVSPPGFCWWLAAPAGEATYSLKVLAENGGIIYETNGLKENVHVPDEVFPAGNYSWTVEAYGEDGLRQDSRTFGSFKIREGAKEDPWIPASELLAKVPEGHPRLLFSKEKLDEIRATLLTNRKEAFDNLINQADEYLGTEAPPEPDYDAIEDPAIRSLEYRKSFRQMRYYHLGAMTHTALAYLMTDNREYGETAKTILLGATEWDPEGISSIIPRIQGDEVGLGLVKSEALTYDWIYDLLTEEERMRVERMIIARADQMLRRLRLSNFLSSPQNSHEGRLPGYLIEHALVMAEHPGAAEWLDYALKAFQTVHPHWAGKDGGWAQGLAYGSAYNSMMISPLESLRRATGKNIWQHAFYDNSPYFWIYCMSPIGEIKGFGDSYETSGANAGIRSLLQFHAERMQSSDIQWWVNQMRNSAGEMPELHAMTGLIRPSTVKSEKPTNMPNDRVFLGVGWAALHSNITNPQEDLLLLFKSSPYGGVSHSYNDQNGFQVLCGGKVLARPGGIRYPHHGSPFHIQYTQQTIAQNAILVNGDGQKSGGGPYRGEIVDFESLNEVGYVCGDATPAYGGKLNKWRRHILLLRPSVICIIDDLESPEASEYQWLMHSDFPLELDQNNQVFTERRGSLVMTAKMFSTIPMQFSQSNQWPLNPGTGFPEDSLENLPEKIWHFKAGSKGKSRFLRIATIMKVERPGETVNINILNYNRELVTLEYETPGAQTALRINLERGEKNVLELKSKLNNGQTQKLHKQ